MHHIRHFKGLPSSLRSWKGNSKYSAEYARDKLNIAVIKSDVGYYIEELGGFPGPFLRYANEMLESEDILKMMEGKENRKILLKECLTFASPGYETKQFHFFIDHEDKCLFMEFSIKMY